MSPPILNKPMIFLRSMAGRVFLILLCGVIGSTVLTLWLAFGERQREIHHFRDSQMVDRTEQVLNAVSALPPEQRERFLQQAPHLGMTVMHEAIQPSNRPPQSALAGMLVEQLGHNFNVKALGSAPEYCAYVPPPAMRNVHRPPQMLCDGLLVTFRDGQQIVIGAVAMHFPLMPLNPDFFRFVLVYLACLAVLAYIVARMALRPLKRLAGAATLFGQDINREPLVECGATEIRQATQAFNAMQARIRSHVQQRTHMLAAITHDLQTPLTRLRLRLEKVDDEGLRTKLIGDLSAMQSMVKEGLDLARSMDDGKQQSPVDLDSLLDSVCCDAVDAGQNVELSGSSRAQVMANPLALRRCLVNLVDNGVKYGQRVEIGVRTVHEKDRSIVHIRIRDHGSGVPPESIDKLFEPFFRLESSRSRNTGGTGLGLTIARNIALQHRGSLALENVAGGGLEACLILPVL